MIIVESNTNKSDSLSIKRSAQLSELVSPARFKKKIFVNSPTRPGVITP
jgi:hypothetical protein